MYDKEISHYNVIIYDNVNGTYRHFETVKRYTEEDAVSYVKQKQENNPDIKYKFKIEQVCNVIGWWN